MDDLKAKRDTHRYIHDQALRLANEGYTPQEIASQIEFPSTLCTRFASRGYYGTVRHNAKAVYRTCFGWYDVNPANLDPLPPAEAAKNDVAATYGQLGCQAESGLWRDVCLTGEYQLRDGRRGLASAPASALGLLRAAPAARALDSMAVRLNGRAADGKRMTFIFIFDDVGESHVLQLENAVLHHIRLGVGDAGLKDLVMCDELEVEGSRLKLLSFLSMIDRPDGRFAIVTP